MFETGIIVFLYSVHLVELKGSGELFGMKAMDKSLMLNRNKVISIDKI
jgi:hypothetical protein